MSIFTRGQYYSQRENINEKDNRIVNMWNFVVDFRSYFYNYGIDNNLGDIFTYNVKSVELPKYTMKTYKRYFGTSERTFPIKRICDGTFRITFYARYNLVNALSRLSNNYVGSFESRNGITKTLKESEKTNMFNTMARVNNTYSISVYSYSDNFDNASDGAISYTFMKPILSSIEYSELGSDNNSILEVTCEFSYNDFRITSDSLYSANKTMIVNKQVDQLFEAQNEPDIAEQQQLDYTKGTNQEIYKQVTKKREADRAKREVELYENNNVDRQWAQAKKDSDESYKTHKIRKEVNTITNSKDN